MCDSDVEDTVESAAPPPPTLPVSPVASTKRTRTEPAEKSAEEPAVAPPAKKPKVAEPAGAAGEVEEVLVTYNSQAAFAESTEPAQESKDESVADPPIEEGKLYVKTLNVKDFCNMIVGFGAAKSLETVLIDFTAEGMKMYGKPKGGSVIVTAFWHKEQFVKYQCPQPVRKAVGRDRLMFVKKQLQKVQYIEITESKEEGNPFHFSGVKQYDDGEMGRFGIHAFEWKCTQRPISMQNIKHMWHITTSASKLATDVNFMDDQSEYINMHVQNKMITLQGVNDTGVVSETVQHDTDTDCKIDFKAFFGKPQLNIVTAAQPLHKSVEISFNADNKAIPVLFSYKLCHQQPASHFSVYIMSS